MPKLGTKLLTRPLLLVTALLIVLSMLRLGVWQLDRADQKQVMLNVQNQSATLPSEQLNLLLNQLNNETYADLRYRRVKATGRFVPDSVVYHDGQVFKSVVGYDVYALLQTDAGEYVLVRLGWTAAGLSRQQLPSVSLPDHSLEISGRFNDLPSAPPIWDPKFNVRDGQVWQFLPAADISDYFDRSVVPMMVELATDENQHAFGNAVVARDWLVLDDQWVGRHKAYALQWFSMAAVFFIACCIVTAQTLRRTKH